MMTIGKRFVAWILEVNDAFVQEIDNLKRCGALRTNTVVMSVSGKSRRNTELFVIRLRQLLSTVDVDQWLQHTQIPLPTEKSLMC